MTEVNKVIYGSDVLIDLTSDTVTENSLAAGATAHAADGSIITGTGYKNIYYVKGTQTSSTGAWKGNLPEVEELYDGLAIDYWLPYAGSGNATLTLTLKNGNDVTANCYIQSSSRLTTHIAANNICHLVYQTVTISGTNYSGWWLVKAWDVNDTAYQLFRGYTYFTADSAVYRYQLLFSVDEDRLTPMNNDNNVTAMTKTMLTNVEFDPFGSIYFYTTTTTYNANTLIPAQYLYYGRGGIDLRYSFNCDAATLTANKNLYLKVVIGTNGMAKIADSSPLVQSLPSTNDGYYYILLGRTQSTSYQCCLFTEHPVFYYDGNKILQYFNDGLDKKVNISDCGGIQVRPNYIISNVDLVDGVSELEAGQLYFYYEA